MTKSSHKHSSFMKRLCQKIALVIVPASAILLLLLCHQVVSSFKQEHVVRQLQDKGFFCLKDRLGNVLEIWSEGPNNDERFDLSFVRALPHLRKLDVAGSHVFDSEMAPLADAINLEELSLFRTSISGDGLKYLSKLPKLRVLSLHGTAVDDAAMNAVASIPSLEELELDETRVTDRGLALIGHMGRLGRLSLGDTQVTDEGLRDLAGLTELYDLSLRGTRVSDVTLVGFQPLRNLMFLDLGHTSVTDATIEWLATDNPKAGLVCLDLSDTQITDQCLKKLVPMRSLGQLNLRNTRVTNEGIQWLLTHIESCPLTHLNVNTELRIGRDSSKVLDHED